MVGLLVALLLAQEPDLLEGDEPAPPPVKQEPDAPLVIPPADGPVPPGVPVPVENPPAVVIKRTPDETRQLLIEERQRLFSQMPSFVLPTALTVAGGLAMIIGGVFAIVSAPAVLSSPARGDPLPFYLGLPAGILGLGGLVFGLMWERERSLAREPLYERIDEIDRELGW